MPPAFLRFDGLTVRKIDAQTGYSLRGATIAFKQIDGSFYTTAVTDHAGIIQFTADSLPIGGYEVYEVSAPEGYEADKSIQTVNWDGKNDVTLTFKDVRKPTLIIYKCDTENLRSLPGASFEVYRDGQLFTTVTTNDNGLAYVPGVTKGYYTVKETAAPAGYVLDSSEHSVYVDAYDPATTDDPRIVVKNEAKPQLRILKYDAQTGKPLSDTTFEVYRDAALLGQYTTDAAGEIYLYDLEPGTYLVQEIAVKPGYVVNSTPQQIEIKAGTENYTLTVLNLLKPGIHLRKLDSDTLRPLAGAKFRVAQIGGNFSREYTTDSSGEIDLTGLDPASYEVTELSAPSGYLIDEAKRTVRINAGENAEFIFTDKKKPVMIIEKKDAATGATLAGATFRIAKVGDEGHYLDRVTDKNGQIKIEGLEPGMFSVQEIAASSGYVLNSQEYHVRLEAGKTSTLAVNNHQRPDLVAADEGLTSTNGVYVTDEHGEIVLTKLVPATYIVTETKAPANYKLGAEAQTVRVNAADTQTLRFYNEPLCTLTVTKLDSSTKKPLAGAEFTAAYSDGRSIGRFTTDKNGKFIVSGLVPNATVIISEEKAPERYIKDGTQKHIIVRSGVANALTFENEPTSTLIIRKYITGTENEPLSGVAFKVTDGNGGAVGPDDGVLYLLRTFLILPA